MSHLNLKDLKHTDEQKNVSLYVFREMNILILCVSFPLSVTLLFGLLFQRKEVPLSKKLKTKMETEADGSGKSPSDDSAESLLSAVSVEFCRLSPPTETNAQQLALMLVFFLLIKYLQFSSLFFI